MLATSQHARVASSWLVALRRAQRIALNDTEQPGEREVSGSGHSVAMICTMNC